MTRKRHSIFPWSRKSRRTEGEERPALMARETLIMRAEEHDRAREYPEAARLWNEAAHRDPPSVPYLIRSGVSWRRAGEHRLFLWRIP